LPAQPGSNLRDAGTLGAIHGADAWQLSCRENYAASVAISSVETMGWLRAGVGIALIAVPAGPARLVGRPAPDGAGMLLMRTIGIRDLVLGLGAVAASRSGDVKEARRWAAAGLASDSLDAATSLASFRSIGKRDSWGAALLAMVFVGGDLQALRSLSRA
jgi:hypothetical protein